MSELERAKGKVWKRLTAERKLEVYLATRDPNAPVGEILRKAGMTLEELRQIEGTVESGALAALKVQGQSSQSGPISWEEYKRVVAELKEKEQALAEMGVEYTLLKKVQRYFSARGKGALGKMREASSSGGLKRRS
jgi:hypothetical protein